MRSLSSFALLSVIPGIVAASIMACGTSGPSRSAESDAQPPDSGRPDGEVYDGGPDVSTVYDSGPDVDIGPGPLAEIRFTEAVINGGVVPLLGAYFVEVGSFGTACDGLQLDNCCFSQINSCSASIDGGIECNNDGGTQAVSSDGGVPADAGLSSVCDGGYVGNELHAGDTLAVDVNGSPDGQLLWDPVYGGYQWTGTNAWPAGANLQVSGPGTCAFPPFIGSVAAVSPLPQYGVSPGQSSKGGTVPNVPLDSPLTVTWPGQPGVGIVAQVTLTSLASGLGGILTCTQDDDTGTLTIPQSTLGMLPASTLVPLTVTVWRTAEKTNPNLVVQSWSGATTHINLQ